LKGIFMRLGFLALTILSAMTLAACGGGGDNNKPVSVTEQMHDVTDTRACNNSLPAGATIEGTWAGDQASPSFHSTLTFVIGRNTSTLTNECHDNSGNVASVSITVPTSYSSTQYKILQGGEREQQSGSLICKINPPQVTFDYQLAGSCLKLSYQGQALIFVSKGQVADNRAQDDILASQQQPQDSHLTAQQKKQLQTVQDQMNQMTMPAMPAMPKMPKAPQFPTEDPIDNN
jgi:hypothetical protein